VWAVQADPISPGSWTMILLPDTQNYCGSDSAAQIFNSQTQWIASHKTTHNIQMVLHQGDLVGSNTDAQFTRAKTAMNILTAAGVPYSACTGNHDYVDDCTYYRDSLFNSSTYFGPGSAYASQAHFQGTAGGFFESGKTDNSYCTFNAGDKDWLVFSTEFGPRDEVVTWMNGVAAAHPNHNFILNTHAYLFSDSTRYDWATKGVIQRWNPNDPVYDPEGSQNDGQQLWDKMVKNYENWKFTFNGHVIYDGTGWLASEGDNGNVVHQMLANYQGKTAGGNGYLRILEFMADGDTVKVSSYSPYLGEYRTAADQGFTLKMSEVSALPPIPLVHGVSAANISVTDGSSVWTVAGSGPQAYAPISPANGADLSVSINSIPAYRDQGVMIATVRQNGRNGFYGTAEVCFCNAFDMDIESEDNIFNIATSRAYNGGEYNMNVATGFFPFADGWIGGHVYNTGMLFDFDYFGVTQNNVLKVGTGRYNVSIDGINSQNDGMLFAVSAENGYNYVSTAPKTDGSGWDIVVRDNTAATFYEFENSQWSFVYVDYDAPGLIGGRVAANGSTLHGEGEFTVTKVGTGVYRVTVTGHSPTDGVLLLTVADSETDLITAADDNIISYQADGSTFLVNVRDRNGSASPLEDGSFVFVFLPFSGRLMPALPGDANYDGTVDEEDAAILAGNWGRANATWAMGDFNLNGRIDAADASVLAANWGNGGGTEAIAGVPEPFAAGLFMTAMISFLTTRWR
ncbi:MAG: hypothetical protein JW719_05380, partial [Pirellulales bacterium]|nr:hypothetical protein [Pirellulales bacterium]